MTKEREDRQNTARKLWSEGKTVKEICEIMQLSYMTVHDYVCDMPDWEDRKRKNKKSEIQALIKAGKSNEEIAELTKSSITTISTYRSQLKTESAVVSKPINYAMPDNFSWKWPVTVNRLLKAAGKMTQPVPKHSREAERQWFIA